MRKLLLSLLLLSSNVLADNNSSPASNDQKESVPETLVDNYKESEMDKAIAKSKSTIQEFHDAMKANDADAYSVKAPITDLNGTEHFWLTDITFHDGIFKGLIGNEPGIVKNVIFGQTWEIKEEDISDWMYMKAGMIHGGFTIDPLLSSYPKDQADELRSKLVR